MNISRKTLYISIILSILIFIKFCSLSNAISIIVYPFIYTEHQISSLLSNSIINFQEKKTLVEQVCRLQSENEKLLADNICLKSQNIFFNDIKEIIEFSKRYEQESFIIAKILAKHFESEHYLLIDGGLNKNIEVDMVVVSNNCIVGKISQVYPYYSKVQLITDPSSRISASCNNIDCVYEGIGNTKMSFISYIDHLKSIDLGELVFSNGNGLIYPSGYALGVVDKVEHDAGFYLKIFITPCIDVEALKYCSVLKKF